jgi:hypothetical protein
MVSFSNRMKQGKLVKECRRTEAHQGKYFSLGIVEKNPNNMYNRDCNDIDHVHNVNLSFRPNCNNYIYNYYSANYIMEQSVINFKGVTTNHTKSVTEKKKQKKTKVFSINYILGDQQQK